MSTISYAQKLLDPRWQKKRLEVMQNNDFACNICGDSEATLHVHHNMYLKGKEPWEYELEQFSLLCKNCHAMEHADKDNLFFEVMSRLHLDGPQCKKEVAIIIAGFSYYDYEPEIDFHRELYELGKNLSKAYWTLIDRKASK
jgi:hypothetical protein